MAEAHWALQQSWVKCQEKKNSITLVSANILLHTHALRGLVLMSSYGWLFIYLDNIKQCVTCRISTFPVSIHEGIFVKQHPALSIFTLVGQQLFQFDVLFVFLHPHSSGILHCLWTQSSHPCCQTHASGFLLVVYMPATQ